LTIVKKGGDMRKVIAVLIGLIFVVGVSSLGYCRGDYKKSHADIKFEDKISMKMHAIMMNKEELKLSDKQISKIKTLKIETKKALIMKNAQIEVLAVDIKSGLWSDKIDVKNINKLIDKKYNIKKEKAKVLVSVCARIKKILSKEQVESLKEIIKAKFKGQKECHKSKNNVIKSKQGFPG
jgi:Spy/CpxP family protein refolding chaperone